ncbi:two pore domain potassium channel family protein [Bacillus lacus]|uniref:Two pore domain potassium channel family protein n=2 Tax=Metabacillus lacus TaxID=1983721 RepID=A0A7X2IZC4_9BACI|nr:two pore domain potassium channel family protein [Metabacillus lacus]
MTSFLLFGTIYLVLIVLFAVIYTAIDMSGAGTIKEHYLEETNLSLPALLLRSLYFSLITIFAVGFGDITPFGLSRLFASIQAFIGFLMPIAIVIHLFPNEERREGN